MDKSHEQREMWEQGEKEMLSCPLHIWNDAYFPL